MSAKPDSNWERLASSVSTAQTPSGEMGHPNVNSLWPSTTSRRCGGILFARNNSQPHATLPQHAVDGSNARISALSKCPVERLSINASSLGYLLEPIGANYIQQGCQRKRRIAIFHHGVQVCGHVLRSVEVFRNVKLLSHLLSPLFLSVGSPALSGALNVTFLSPLGSPAKEDYNDRPVQPVVDPVPRTAVEAQLVESASQRLAVTKVAKLNLSDGCQDVGSILPVSQAVHPSVERRLAARPAENANIYRRSHLAIVALKLHKSTSSGHRW